ncbi:unnamed protein product, partial [Didymodactylos carnosus]
MSALLESLVKAHHQLRIIMTNNDSIHRLNKLQMETIEKLAEMLEPFKDQEQEVERCHEPIRDLVEEEKEFINSTHNDTSHHKQQTSSPSPTAATQTPPRKRAKFTSKYENKTRAQSHSNNEEFQVYLQMFIDGLDNEDEDNDYDLETNDYVEYNPLYFWQQQQTQLKLLLLARVARRIFSIPATSAAVERLFSASGNLITPIRANLDPDTVNNSIFIRSAMKQKNIVQQQVEERLKYEQKQRIKHERRLNRNK